MNKQKPVLCCNGDCQQGHACPMFRIACEVAESAGPPPLPVRILAMALVLIIGAICGWAAVSLIIGAGR